MRTYLISRLRTVGKKKVSANVLYKPTKNRWEEESECERTL
ncbi:hypothetical protein BpJC7_32350 [Weizmannia acidilactici]|uniref:Uncharacterized protein n=1 Tax=Weizmannia acidilactici TaxID=2607726 RepID=A0A5J4JMP6_9BACI|nr:hypothetical protein BpJC7_32330 [Weizmannia acidilactici]GER71932.1 hypothetical protein BpJC7_32350 [Weizmannia acidilactici]